MFSYVMLGVNDLPQAQQFYDAFFGVLGVPAGITQGERCFYVGDHGTFAITLDSQPRPSVGATGFGTCRPRMSMPPTPLAWRLVGVPATMPPAGMTAAPMAASTWVRCSTPVATKFVCCTNPMTRQTPWP